MNIAGSSRRCLRMLLIGSCFVLASCSPNEMIRSNVSGPCTVDGPRQIIEGHEPQCAHSALEEVKVVAKLGDDTQKVGSYILGFTEFDDEGKTWQPKQEQLIFDRMKTEAASQDLSIIVFVHGWKHNAKETDGNVQAFQGLLQAITTAELQPADTQPRKVIGIYAGWRGESGPAGILDNLTFWTRKGAAQRVAAGSIRGLLGKVRAFRDSLNANPPNPNAHGTRMLTMGHSFGGLIVYSALTQYFVDRAAASLINAQYFPHTPNRGPTIPPGDDPRMIPSYGDLVVLINPAIEAMRYEPIRELVAQQHTGHPGEQSYAPFQTPVMVEITSVGSGWLEGDWATGLAFPIGRAVDTVFEATTEDPRTGENEHAEILRTMGQYKPFWSHDLNISADDAGKLGPAADQVVLDQRAECRDVVAFERKRQDGYLLPGWQRHLLSGAILTHDKSRPYDPNSPFWIIRAHPTVIADHDDILNPVLKSFLTQLYQDVYLLKDHKCDEVNALSRPRR